MNSVRRIMIVTAGFLDCWTDEHISPIQSALSSVRDQSKPILLLV